VIDAEILGEPECPLCVGRVRVERAVVPEQELDVRDVGFEFVIP